MQAEEQGAFPEIIPDRYLTQDLSDATVLNEVLSHVQSDTVQPLKLSNSMKLNPHGQKVIK